VGQPTSRPGWDRGWGVAVKALVPLRRFKPESPDVLYATRLLWLGIAYSLPLYLVVLLFMDTDDVPDAWASVVVVAVGLLVNVLAIPVIIRSMVAIEPNDPETRLVITYRTGMLYGIGASESVGLLAFAASFVSGSYWTYVLSLPFSMIGLVRTGPFQRTFRRCDRLLAERGSPYRMSDAIRRSLGRT
jgi:hypothetical protein